MARQPGRLLGRLYDRLPEAARGALHAAVSIAQRRGVDLYLVGGGVRDLLLGSVHADLDLVVEEDALGLASALGGRLQARIVQHRRFGTAVVEGPGFRLDLARARTERYERPGALPSVRPGRLVDDLARRDFTINAMALRLSGAQASELIDPHGGRADLAAGAVRVLHDTSFQDDPTRILRALRYAGRLGFRIERRTASRLRRDLGYLDCVSGARLRHEVERIAAEGRAGQIVRLAQRFEVLSAVHPALCAGPRALRALKRLPQVATSHRDAVLFCLLLAHASLAAAEGAIERLSFTGLQARAVRGFLALRTDEAALGRASLRPSDAVAILASRPVAALEAFALVAERPSAGNRARRYLAEWRYVRPRMDGRDVEALGVPHGPLVGEVLALLREARLDGRTRTRDDEEALVRATLARRRPLARVRYG